MIRAGKHGLGYSIGEASGFSKEGMHSALFSLLAPVQSRLVYLISLD